MSRDDGGETWTENVFPPASARSPALARDASASRPRARLSAETARERHERRALDAVDRMVVKSAMEDLRKVADSLDADAWMYRPKREA